jgi:DNA-binding response OmpR family regulator
MVKPRLKLLNDFEVIMAANGPDALKLAERLHPNLVLLDVKLPGMDGYEICRALRSMVDLSQTRIIMVTAKAMPSERARGLEAGADAYLTKPFDERDLLVAMWACGIKAPPHRVRLESCSEPS